MTIDNGWMTREVFNNWLKIFIERITQRPILLIFDGHTSHLGLETIKLARDNNISLIKLPSHTTDLLQPLDVSCFRSLKLIWDKELTSFQRSNNCNAISKSQFVDILGKIWPVGLSQNNILSGFEKTGIYPTNRTKYPKTLFNPIKLASYENQGGRTDSYSTLVSRNCKIINQSLNSILLIRTSATLLSIIKILALTVSCHRLVIQDEFLPLNWLLNHH